MIDLYYWTTPNGHKITIFLEEAALPYQIIPINISNKEQFNPDYLKISPNNKIPAILDRAPLNTNKNISIFESGAILLYLADKINRFIPSDIFGRTRTLEWLFWQVSGLGPSLGQANHFLNQASEKIPYAMKRYVEETQRLLNVLNQQLANHEYIADSYSIADIACFPWIARVDQLTLTLDNFPHVKRWYKEIAKRPAIQRAYQIALEVNASMAMPIF